MAWKNVQYENGKFRTNEGGGGGGSSTLAGLDDVNMSSPANGQVLKYNNTTNKWENANESGGGGTVTDVTVDGTSVVNQQGVAEIPAIPDGLHHYSTTEHIIATWIDGKPVYECVLVNTALIDLIADTWVKTEFDKGNIGKIIKCSLTNITYLAFHSGLSAGFVDDKLAINSARSMNYAIGDCAIVLQYTKTTDV